MVKVGDTYNCHKTRLWANKGGYLSRGQLTLLNLGPQPDSMYGEKYVLVRDSQGAEGWNPIGNFIHYKQGEKYSGKSDNIRRQWMTMEQLKSARAAERVEKQKEAAASSSSNAAVPAARRPAPPPVKRSRGMFQDPSELDLLGEPPQPRDRGLGIGEFSSR